LFSTMHPLTNPLQNALYQKGIFLVIVKRNPYTMFTGKDWNWQLERQYRVFVVRIEVTPPLANQTHRANNNPFKIIVAYFFCTFCKRGLVNLRNSTTTNILSLKLASLSGNWVPRFAQHNLFSDEEDEHANEEACRKSDVMDLYNSKRVISCESNPMLARMIVAASGINSTLKLQQEYDKNFVKIPRISVYTTYDNEFELCKYSSPMLRRYEHPSIIYCFNLEKESVAQTNMWTKYVSLDTWSMVGLCLVLLSILNAFSGSHQKSFTIRNLFLFVSSLLKLIRILGRQSWSHKWKLFGLVEIAFSTLISVYENSITAGVVVPLVPQPYSNTRELYDNNYTFVVEQDNFPEISNWLSDEYSTKHHPKVINEENFANIRTWLRRFFLKPVGGKKFAIIGDLSKSYHYQAVTFAKETNHTCYQMYPQEGEIMPRSVYFAFRSAVASSLQKGVLLLQAFGFTTAFEAAKDYLGYSVALRHTRGLAAEYGYNGITYNDLKNYRLKENMVTLGNLKSILYFKVTLNLVSGVVLFVELVPKIKFS